MRVQTALTMMLVAFMGATLIGCGVSQAMPEACTASAETPSGDEVQVYFGCGCFWHVQHAFVGLEMTELCRTEEAITSRTAYGGGHTGADGLVCYHNDDNKADYGTLGDAEVVSMSVPKSAFPAFAKQFWTLCPGGARQDSQDQGGEYRSVIGLPGGLGNTDLKDILETHSGGVVKLVAGGEGGDEDTLGTDKVYVYDSKTTNPAHTAEKYHQFHDDMSASYGEEYSGLRKYAKATDCPGDEYQLETE